MFLDNVVHDRAEILKPWREFRKQGNSLFLWRLAFGFICFVLFMIAVTLFFTSGLALYEDSYSPTIPIMFIVGWAIAALVMIVIISYISTFLSHFVAPIMYKHNLSTNEGWRRFSPMCPASR